MLIASTELIGGIRFADDGAAADDAKDWCERYSASGPPPIAGPWIAVVARVLEYVVWPKLSGDWLWENAA